MCENLSFRSSNVKAIIDIFFGIDFSECVKVIFQGDPLVELPEILDFFSEFSLAEKEQCSQKAVVELKVEKKPDFFECERIQYGLGLVDDDDGVLASMEVGVEMITEGFEEFILSR